VKKELAAIVDAVDLEQLLKRHLTPTGDSKVNMVQVLRRHLTGHGE
jgi:hypothetical protein